MRFMIIVKTTPEWEAGVMPSPQAIAAMGRFNDALIAAGVLLAAEGLHPSAKGARVRREQNRIVVTDGPFSETKELLGGFWLIQVKDRDEALAWARRVPLDEGEEVEIRQVFEVGDGVAGEIAEESVE